MAKTHPGEGEVRKGRKTRLHQRWEDGGPMSGELQAGGEARSGGRQGSGRASSPLMDARLGRAGSRGRQGPSWAGTYAAPRNPSSPASPP